MPTGIIKLKLGASVNMPTRRLHALLAESADGVNVAGNAMLWHWMRWRKDNPDWQPGPATLKDGTVKVDKDGKPKTDNPLMSSDIDRELYRVGCDSAVRVAAKLVSARKQDVLALLTTKMPWNYEGTERYRWQAILAHRESVPNFRSMAVPVPKQDVTFAYCGDSFGNDKRAAEMGKSECVIRFPLLSRATGCDVLSPVVRLEVSQLSKGNRQLLRRIARGELKMCDSELSERDGKWFLMLAYHVPIIDHNLDRERRLTLTPGKPSGERPFHLRFHDEGWCGVGDGKPLVAEFRRLDERRRGIRWRSRNGTGRGRGKRWFYRTLKPMSRAFVNMQERFTKQIIADIISKCIRNNCGTLLYREPSMPLRQRLWFTVNGLDFDWTAFLGRLTFKCSQHDIELVKERIGIKPHQEEYGWKPERKGNTRSDAECVAAV